jgi:hypothetical protein
MKGSVRRMRQPPVARPAHAEKSPVTLSWRLLTSRPLTRDQYGPDACNVLPTCTRDVHSTVTSWSPTKGKRPPSPMKGKGCPPVDGPPFLPSSHHFTLLSLLATAFIHSFIHPPAAAAARRVPLLRRPPIRTSPAELCTTNGTRLSASGM